jgi:hypothetical protein
MQHCEKIGASQTELGPMGCQPIDTESSKPRSASRPPTVP